MVDKKKRKALIVYASITGNTEQVALRFKKTIEKKGQPWGDWDCDIFKITKNTYRENIPYNAQKYDLFMAGGPIWSGIPPLYMIDDHKGALLPIMSPEFMEQSKKQVNKYIARVMAEESVKASETDTIEAPISSIERNPNRKAIVFITYGGQGQGPVEAMTSLSVLEQCCSMGFKVIGKFACCGKMWAEPTVDPIAAKFDWMVGDATVAIAKYKENPNHPDFANLTAKERKLFDNAVGWTEHFSSAGDPKIPMARAWHWDYAKRPTERDLLKAEIFISEILEDCYGGGIEKTPDTVSQYLCIA